MLYDSSLLDNPDPSILNPDWLHAHAELSVIGTGRGQAWFVKINDHEWVLRKYLRGGLVAKFNRECYLGWFAQNSRSWKEWQLLYDLREKGLPVPRPVAAVVCWKFGRLSGVYQASILVEKIQNSRTLADCISTEALTQEAWQAVGACICQFHDAQVYHADLNANNILVDNAGKVYLIDFDRGKIRENDGWKKQNMDRLLRSLNKLKNNRQVSYFNDSDWAELVAGYSAK